uniref:Uncharacterized protein n=1 Tax=Steinernema glaseri TaxID=37863 RepID=A0A1I7YUZ4_9BILA
MRTWTIVSYVLPKCNRVMDSRAPDLKDLWSGGSFYGPARVDLCWTRKLTSMGIDRSIEKARNFYIVISIVQKKQLLHRKGHEGCDRLMTQSAKQQQAKYVTG